jgi:hypothetical protein
MFASVVAIEGGLAECIQNYSDDRCCLLELLRFFGKHPHTRYSRCAVVQALKNEGIFAERGLKYLAGKGLVSMEIENTIRLYSLTREEPMRSWVLDLLRYDWYHWQSLVRQVGLTD